MAGNNGQFANLMEGDEIERFLQAFILPENIRTDAQSRNPSVTYPQNTNDVLQDVKKIWDQKGFLSPAELRAELITHYTPNADPVTKDFITQTELSRNKPELVTGYLNKEHAYISTGLAHLYAAETGRPIAMAEVDFSNMGGTNEEFKRRIAKERNIDLSAVKGGEAEHMTDMAVKLLSDSMVETLGKELPPNGKIVPIRTGGDELRLLFTGIDDPAELAKITEKMHAHIEYHVAAMGLQDHAHLKDPTNPVRNGFGAAISARDMRDITDPTTVIQDADEKIKAEKEKIGHMRLGTIDEKAETLRIEQAITDKKINVPEGTTQKDFITQKLAEERAMSGLISDALHTANPHRNPNLDRSLSGFKSYFEMTAAATDPSPLVHRDVPAVLSNDNHATQTRPTSLQPLASIEDRRLAHTNEFFAQNNIEPSAAERHFMGQSVKGLTSIDPSAQVMMPKDMIGLIETYATETDEYRKNLHPDNPAVQEGLRKSGLSTINEVSPHTMAVSFHNLAGLNNEHGHHNADLVLRTMGNDIIGKSLTENGFSANGKDAFSIAHHGGGNFSVVIAPSITGADGKIEFISPDRIKTIEQDISHKVQDLNGQKIADFLEAKGVVINAPADSPIRSSTFADIQDPKVRAHTTSPEITGRVNGIHVAIASSPVAKGSEPFRGDAHIGQIRREADAKINTLRDQHLANASRQITAQDMDVLRSAGNWIIGASDQANGGFKPAVTLDITGKSPDEVAKIQKVLNKLNDPQSGTRVINGLEEKGLTHPLTASKKTLSMEGGASIAGIKNIIKVQNTLKDAGVGHFEWNDDVRDWKNTTQNKVISEIPTTPKTIAPATAPAPPTKALVAEPITPTVTAAPTTIDPPEVKTSKKPTIHDGHARGAGSGIGVGMGAYGLTQKLGEDGTAKKDLANAETRNLAKAGIAADAGGIIADSADTIATLQKVSKGLQTASKVTKVAAPVGAALTVVSGVVDYKIAAKQKDAARAADAIGGSAGGFAGAAAGGLVGAKGGAAIGGAIGAFFGGIGAVPGAAIGGFIGGIGGAITGAFVGAEVGKKATSGVVKDYIQKGFDEEKATKANEISIRKSDIKKAPTPEILKPELAKEIKPAVHQVARETTQDYSNEARKSAANETRTTTNAASTHGIDDTKFAKSAPDLSSAFTKSAATPSLSLVPKEHELSTPAQATHNKVLQTRAL